MKILVLLLVMLSISCQTKSKFNNEQYYTLEEIISSIKKEYKIDTINIKIASNYSQLNCPVYFEETGYLSYTCVKDYKIENNYNFYIPTEICQSTTQTCSLDKSIQKFTEQGICIFYKNNQIIPINAASTQQEIDIIRYISYKSKEYFFLDSYNPYSNGSTNFITIYIIYKNNVFSINSVVVLDNFFNDFDNDGNLDVITITHIDNSTTYIITFNSINNFGISANMNISPIKIEKNEKGLYKFIKN